MDKFTKGWVGYLRNTARQESQRASEQVPNNDTFLCTECESPVSNDIEAFKEHCRNNPKHASWDEAAITNAFNFRVNQSSQLPDTQEKTRPITRKRGSGTLENNPEPSSGLSPASNPPGGDQEARGFKKQRSPPSSLDPQRGPSSPTSRSKARQADTHAFSRGHTHKNPPGRLWSPDDDKSRTPQSRSVPVASSSSPRPTVPAKAPRNLHNVNQGQAPSASDNVDPTTTMMLQPETRPISYDQLLAEVKGIYAGLVMVEAKCREVDKAQAANTDANSKLNNEQWQALIALHRTLLHEHHDFFLASQHPSAGEALEGLALKYGMPARMWRHGIHSFLELLRHRLPASLEHMLTFLYLAYSIMALLYETVREHKSTWIECLGDLGRYRMAIEDDDIRDRETWTGVSRRWYTEASDLKPWVGRLYHHLAILARPNALQQLFYYAKSLCVGEPFHSTRESIMTLFDPVLSGSPVRLKTIDAAFVRVQGILFSGKSHENLEESMDEFLDLLDSHIGRSTKRWLESGYYIGITLNCSLLGYGNEENVLMKAMTQSIDDSDVVMEGGSNPDTLISEAFEHALSFAVRTYTIVIRRWGDTNTLPCLHTMLVFLHHMTQYPAAMAHIEKAYPWKLIALMLNHLLLSCEVTPRIESSEFPCPDKWELRRPFPEDFAMNGLLYAQNYYPVKEEEVINKDGKADKVTKTFFDELNLEQDEKYFELASMVLERKERILWLGHKIAASGQWLTWDPEARKFSVADKYDVEVEGIPLVTADSPEHKGSPKRTLPARGKDADLLSDANEQRVCPSDDHNNTP